MARQKINPDETGQEKFRRVVAQRTKQLLKRYDQITNMASQPSYSPSAQDVEKLLSMVQEYHNSFVNAFTNALTGKNAKDYAIEWD